MESVGDYAKKYIRRLILENELRPGEHVTEEKIARRLKISRPPIREAFKSLEENGLLERKARRGVYVSEINEKDLCECFMLRMALYGLAIRMCVKNITSKDTSRLEKILSRMQLCVNNDCPDIHKYQSLNRLFHNTTIDIAKYDRLKKFCAALDDQMCRYSYLPLKSKSYLLASYKYHQRILCAIKLKDIETALKLNEAHIEKGLEFARKTFS